MNIYSMTKMSRKYIARIRICTATLNGFFFELLKFNKIWMFFVPYIFHCLKTSKSVLDSLFLSKYPGSFLLLLQDAIIDEMRIV